MHLVEMELIELIAMNKVITSSNEIMTTALDVIHKQSSKKRRDGN